MDGRAMLGWLLPLLAAAAVAPAGEPERRMTPGDVTLTVYPPTTEQGDWGEERRELAVVKECRTIDLPAGVSHYSFTGVTEEIDATTVRFVDLTDPLGSRILEQNYHYDLVGEASLLRRFLERPIQFVDSQGQSHAGALLSQGRPLILKTRRGPIEIIGYDQEGGYTFRLSEVPKDLVMRPTLAWSIRAKKAGKHDVVVSYQTGGISWRADYAAVVKDGDARMDLSGWVTLRNESGARFADARVKLFAGHVRRVDTQEDHRRRGFSDDPATEGQALPGEKSFFEYHLYALEQPTTLENRQTKQIELAAAHDIPVRKVYTYDGLIQTRAWDTWKRRDETYGTRCRKTVRVNLEFDNTKAAHLGFPLPAGIVRAYKRDDADGALEFIGEDRIAHLPSGETARLYFGDAFDIVGERTRVSFERPERHQIRETYEVELRNHKPEPVTVHVLEHLYRSVNWKIEESSQPHKKLDSDTVEFALRVPANGKATVRYKVFYWWQAF